MFNMLVLKYFLFFCTVAINQTMEYWTEQLFMLKGGKEKRKLGGRYIGRRGKRGKGKRRKKRRGGVKSYAYIWSGLNGECKNSYSRRLFTKRLFWQGCPVYLEWAAIFSVVRRQTSHSSLGWSSTPRLSTATLNSLMSMESSTARGSLCGMGSCLVSSSGLVESSSGLVESSSGLVESSSGLDSEHGGCRWECKEEILEKEPPHFRQIHSFPAIVFSNQSSKNPQNCFLSSSKLSNGQDVKSEQFINFKKSFNVWNVYVNGLFF